MGLVIKLKKNQRIYFGDTMLEIDYQKGQIKLFIDSPKPTSFKITREDLETYKKRMIDTYKGGKNENRLCNLQSVQVSAGAW